MAEHNDECWCGTDELREYVRTQLMELVQPSDADYEEMGKDIFNAAATYLDRVYGPRVAGMLVSQLWYGAPGLREIVRWRETVETDGGFVSMSELFGMAYITLETEMSRLTAVINFAGLWRFVEDDAHGTEIVHVIADDVERLFGEVRGAEFTALVTGVVHQTGLYREGIESVLNINNGAAGDFTDDYSSQ